MSALWWSLGILSGYSPTPVANPGDDAEAELQLEQVGWPGLAVTVPGEQSAWSVEPVLHDEPAGQSVH